MLRPLQFLICFCLEYLLFYFFNPRHPLYLGTWWTSWFFHFNSVIYTYTYKKITRMWRRWVHFRIYFCHLLMNLKNKHLLKELLKWTNKKQNNFNIYSVAFKKRKKEKHLWISISKSRWYDLQFLRYILLFIILDSFLPL